MSTLKKAKVVMLPTNRKAPCITKRVDCYGDFSGYYYKEILDGRDTKCFALYIIEPTTNSSYSKGDWFLALNNPNSKLSQPIQVVEKSDRWLRDSNQNEYLLPDCRKIIASTNPLIIFEAEDTRGQNVSIEIPQPSNSFIQKYIEEYNKGNEIIDILVEYEEIIYNPEKEREYQSNDRIYIEDCDKQTRLKINYNDNTITIKKVKEIYTKEEVYQILEKYTSFIWNEVGIHYPISLGKDAKDKFINSEL